MLVSSPLRKVARPETLAGAELRDLESAREAKYREIRDAELDHRTGKLSDDDYAAVDSALRAEAVEILRGIDTINAR
ncbi:MAG TPA: hypothetical protein VMU90_11400, partial [Solirubrobacteraceae bacterium]|nr:hypothetical protein [Solirubrobacteraceae bacterium]